MAGSQPRRKQLEVWLEAIQKPVTQDYGRTLVKPFAGARVRIKEDLGCDRTSLMRGAEGPIQYISNMGRLAIKSCGRTEYFDQTEVEVLSGLT